MSSAAKPAYVKMTVACTSCQAKQIVHVLAHAGFTQMGPQEIACAKCSDVFEVFVPNRIIDGPFLA